MSRQGSTVCVMVAFTLAFFVLADTDAADGVGPGFRIVRGEGSVCAAGSGIAQFHGTGSVVAHLAAGQLILSDETAVVEIKGKGLKHLFANGWVLYQGFDGWIHLEGEDVFAQIVGKDVRMKAEGEGVILLTGKGAYRSPCDASGEPFGFFGKEGIAIELGDYIAEPEELVQ